MAIFSLNHAPVGRTTHIPRTAGAYARYIARPEAATRVLGERMPTGRAEARAWLDAGEQSDRKNARIIDKVMVALPIELSHDQRAELLHEYCEAMSKGRASWMAAIHDGPSDADNPHAHIIFRDRDFETGKRVMLTTEYGSTDRLREGWEEHANRALERAGRPERIDRRSLEDQGIDREAGIHVGPNARVLEERGERPVSLPRQVMRIIDGEAQPIIIDYPSIDGGRTRAEENDERRRRNRARQQDHGEPGIAWTDRAGMVSQQRSALQWSREANERASDREGRTDGTHGTRLHFFEDREKDAGRELDR